MSPAARSHSDDDRARTRVLLAATDVEALQTAGELLRGEGHSVSVARNEEDLLHLLLSVEGGTSPAPDTVALEARLLGPRSLRALRTLRQRLPQTALLFVASSDDRASRVFAAHLGGRVVPRPLAADPVRAAALEAAAARIEIEEQGPTSGMRRAAEGSGKERARS